MSGIFLRILPFLYLFNTNASISPKIQDHEGVKASLLHPIACYVMESNTKHDKWTDFPPLWECRILPLPFLTSCISL